MTWPPPSDGTNHPRPAGEDPPGEPPQPPGQPPSETPRPPNESVWPGGQTTPPPPPPPTPPPPPPGAVPPLQPPAPPVYPPVADYPPAGGQPPGGYGGYAPTGGYAQPYPTYPGRPSRGTNTMAILALVLSLVFAPAGIVCGHIAKRQIAQTGEDGSGLATAGLIIGYVLTGLYAVLCCGIVGLAVLDGRTGG